MSILKKINLFSNSENVVQNKKCYSKIILRGSKAQKKRANIITVSKLQLLF